MTNMRLIKIFLGLVLTIVAEHSYTSPICSPSREFAGVTQCNWACPDYRKGTPPLSIGAMRHVARCAPQVGKVPSFFTGTVALSGQIEAVDTTSWGEVLVFLPDAKSAHLLPSDRQGTELWFVNKSEARKLLRAPKLDSQTSCWTAPAKITISNLLADIGDQDGNHDWVVLREVNDLGKFKNYGCSLE